ncbi:MAG: hypothetical protein GX905_04815 [Bacteroidales bacterium]|nr:hypothetical protein [Bacteroidales bacterium]
MLYGISPDKFETLKIDSYFPDRKILRIPCSIRKDLHIDLELPYILSIEITNYLSERLNRGSKLLFTKRTSSKIDSSFLKDVLNKIRISYDEKYKNSGFNNSFTPTGLQKYAIIKMIETGMNQSLIIDFTGQNQDIFNDCQTIVDEYKKLNRNRYINHMLRGIDTYDKL